MATSSARMDSNADVPPGVGLAHSGLAPGVVTPPVRLRPPVLKPCAVLEFRYRRTFFGIGSGLPTPLITLRDARNCQNSADESTWNTTGSVAGRCSTPPVMPESGSLRTAYVNGG